MINLNIKQEMNEDNPNNISEDEKENEPSSKKSDKVSLFWNYFNLVKGTGDDKKSYTQCTVNGCNEKLTYHNSTSAIQKHLKSYHVTAYESCVSNKSKSKQSTLTSSNYKLIPVSKEKAQSITIAIARFIATDMRPINLIEGPGFISLLSYLEPSYKLPCRTTFANTVENLYKSAKNDIIAILKEERSFGITFDYWQSIPLKSYLTLTIHFGSKSFNHYNYVLKTIEVSESHTGIITANNIQSILEEFHLKEDKNFKFYAVSDMAPNSKKNFNSLILVALHIFCTIL